ncbi:MAG: hypothetical protein V1267_02600, partial [Alphaproteobacteria bacterium]|nr:hypothetical protein [Alphaproteobacteria bacterium]
MPYWLGSQGTAEHRLVRIGSTFALATGFPVSLDMSDRAGNAVTATNAAERFSLVTFSGLDHHRKSKAQYRERTRSIRKEIPKTYPAIMSAIYINMIKRLWLGR